MYQKPKAAKKLFFDVIPKTVDEYLAYLAKYPHEEPKAKLENPDLAHPRRRAAAGRSADQLRAAAEPGVGVERGGQGDAVGLHPQVRGRRHARGAPRARPSRRLRASPTTTTSSSRRRPTGRRPSTSARRWRRWRRSSARSRRARAARSCRTSSTRSARRTPSSRCAPGSRRSTRCCSASPKARASAASSSSTASRTRGR